MQGHCRHLVPQVAPAAGAASTSGALPDAFKAMPPELQRCGKLCCRHRGVLLPGGLGRACLC
jgi:hypothetical protein